MRYRLLALAGLLSIAASSIGSERTNGVVALEGATVIDGRAGSPLRDAILLIEGGRITAIGAKQDVQPPPDARRIDYRDKFIIPGLFDLHVHPALVDGLRLNADLYTAQRLRRDAVRSLYFGVMHLASMGHDFPVIFEFRDAQRAGREPGARIYTAGRGFAPPGGWRPPVPLGSRRDEEWMNRPDNAADARERVRREAARGVDLIKIWVDDLEDTGPKLAPDTYAAIIDEAHAHGLPVFAHVVEVDDAIGLIRRGVDALAHVPHDRAVDEAFLSAARARGVTQTTTLVRFHTALDYADGDWSLPNNPQLQALYPDQDQRAQAAEFLSVFEARRDVAQVRRDDSMVMANIGRIAAAGIPVATATDTAAPAHYFGLALHREMELLAQAGLSPPQILQAATIDAARALGVDDRYGSLEAGKVADLLVLDANPLADIRNTQRIHAIYMNGELQDRDRLAAIARE